MVGRELAQALLFTSARVQPGALEAGGYPFRHTELVDGLGAVLDGPESGGHFGGIRRPPSTRMVSAFM